MEKIVGTDQAVAIQRHFTSSHGIGPGSTTVPVNMPDNFTNIVKRIRPEHDGAFPDTNAQHTGAVAAQANTPH